MWKVWKDPGHLSQGGADLLSTGGTCRRRLSWVRPSSPLLQGQPCPPRVTPSIPTAAPLPPPPWAHTGMPPSLPSAPSLSRFLCVLLRLGFSHGLQVDRMMETRPLHGELGRWQEVGASKATCKVIRGF